MSDVKPLECVTCGGATGPPHPVDADHPGWVCPSCYDKGWRPIIHPKKECDHAEAGGAHVHELGYAALRAERDAILSYAAHRLGEPTNKVGNDAIRWYALAGGEGR